VEDADAGHHRGRLPHSAQGIASFTALQRRGIPSRLLVIRETTGAGATAHQWYGEVFNWLGRIWVMLVILTCFGSIFETHGRSLDGC
jgi:hypothetical protein